MPPKDTTTGAPTATLELDQPVAPPPTAEQTAAAEKSLGLATTQQAPTAGSALKTTMRMGVAPTNIDEGYRLAQMFASSELVPKNFRNRPMDVLVAIQMGVEIGLPPMQALQSIAVINGRPSVWGDGFLALIVGSPLYQDHDEYYEVDGQRRDGLTVEDLRKDSTVAVCTFVRRGKGTPVTRRFSVGQARKAGLLGKGQEGQGSKEGPWTNYPDRMLSMRARSWAGRDAYPDLLRGIRTAEEAMDTPDTEIELPPAREVRRISDTKTEAPTNTTAAPAEIVEIGPIGVKDVEQFLGGFTVTLTDGRKVDTTETADAIELEKLKGGKYQIRLTCEKGGDGTLLQLRSFGMAD